jgi:hypothetical protein
MLGAPVIGGAATLSPQRAINIYEVDQRRSGAQLRKPQIAGAALEPAAQHLGVEGDHAVEVGDANVDRIRMMHGVSLVRLLRRLTMACTRCQMSSDSQASASTR